MSGAHVTVERPSDSAGVVRVSAGGGGGGEMSLAPAARQSSPVAVPAAAPVRVLNRPARPPPPLRPRPPVPPAPAAREVQDALAGLANPSKLRAPEEEEEEPEDSEYDSGDEGGDGGSFGSGEEEDGDEPEDLPDEENEPFEDELRPSEGFRSLDEEKSDIIFKLTRFKKRGLPGLRNFTVHSDIRELRAELKRIKTELDMDASVKFQRKMLLAVVGGIEFINRKYSPFDLQLDGWSETVHSDLGSYDEVFEQLFYKYRNKVSAPPEIKLLLMVAGSGMLFHYSNTMMKALPQMTPEAMQGMQTMFQNMQQQQQQQQQPQGPLGPQGPQGPAPPPPPPSEAGRHQMRGPGMDMGALLGGLPAMMPTMGPPPPQASRLPARQPPPPPRPTIRELPGGDDDASDRLSDVVSDDLESVPEDLQSMASSDAPRKRGVKQVTLGTGAPPKRPRKTTKNVVVI